MTKEQFLLLAESHWPELEALQKEENWYEFEKRLDEIMTELGRKALEHSLGEVPQDRRKKRK
jgi:hypothetical protein